MNSIWSNHVQGVMTLYLSRKLRFDDIFFTQYDKLFDLDHNKELKILEIGCGPGALAESMHRWYPNAQITGVDRDSNFIMFAKENVPGVCFMEGDAVQLPFENDSFDVTITNTVQEHIEPAAFWSEQRRVLRPGGICLCLSARKSINCTASCLETTHEEKAFWDSIPQADSIPEEFGVGRYSMSESELPASMIKALEENSIVHQVEAVDAGGHGFAVGFGTSVEGWIERADAFFETLNHR